MDELTLDEYLLKVYLQKVAEYQRRHMRNYGPMIAELERQYDDMYEKWRTSGWPANSITRLPREGDKPWRCCGHCNQWGNCERKRYKDIDEYDMADIWLCVNCINELKERQLYDER